MNTDSQSQAERAKQPRKRRVEAKDKKKKKKKTRSQPEQKWNERASKDLLAANINKDLRDTEKETKEIKEKKEPSTKRLKSEAEPATRTRVLEQQPLTSLSKTRGGKPFHRESTSKINWKRTEALGFLHDQKNPFPSTPVSTFPVRTGSFIELILVR
jgi:hypothetical protein